MVLNVAASKFRAAPQGSVKYSEEAQAMALAMLCCMAALLGLILAVVIVCFLLDRALSWKHQATYYACRRQVQKVQEEALMKGKDLSLCPCCVECTSNTPAQKKVKFFCGHGYHLHCINRWFQENPNSVGSCPVCEVWKGAARRWLAHHPTFDSSSVTRQERQDCWELRAAFAVAMAAAHREGRRLSALPCDRSSRPTANRTQPRSPVGPPPTAKEATKNMEPALVDAVIDLPLPLLSRLGAVGVETAADVMGLFPNVDEFLEELRKAMGRSVTPELSMEVAVVYGRLNGMARKAKAHAIEVVVAERLSVYPSGAPSSAAAPVVAASTSTRGMKPLIGLGTGSVEPTTAASQAGVAGCDAVAKQAKLDLLFHVLLDYVLDPQALGIDPGLLQDPLGRAKVRETVLHGACRLSTPRLGALVSSFRRWVRFCQDHGWEPNRPKPFQLASFLHFVSQGGPTAAASMHAALKWFADQAGAALDMGHPLVSPKRFHAGTHTARQAPELQPWELLNLACLFGRARGNHKLLLAWGKARKKGARPAYGWALPELTWAGHAVGRLLEDFYRHEVLATSGFLVPALQLAADELWEVSDTTPLLLGRAMSRGRFLEIFRGAMMQCGLDAHSARGSQYNRLRRFMPTLANVVELSDLDAQAVGSWTEVTQGGGRSVPRAKASTPMGRHYYAGSRVLRSAVVKVRLLDRFMELWRLRQPHVQLTSDGLLPVDAWTWQGFQELHSQTPWSSACGAGGEPEAAPSDSEDSSSSASDQTADPDDLNGILPDTSAAMEMPWFKQGSRTHVVSETTESGRLVPYCRTSPFVQDPSKRGEGFLAGGLDSVCKRCLGRMPRGLYLSLAEHCGWSA
eukprot:s83_g12.t2